MSFPQLNCIYTNYGDDYKIPTKVETLLARRKAEQNRIEYKLGLIHRKLCIQYANDIAAGVDGG